MARTQRLIAILGAALLLLVVAGPALAKQEPRNSKAKGGAVRSAWTEDNDENDGDTRNNIVDAGDNRHPSGRDRSVEAGGSGNQGKAQSDPDDDGRGPERSNGGPDRPNGSGGTDLADQDGNNGCGNDDDFEDDNEGLCLGPQKKAASREIVEEVLEEEVIEEELPFEVLGDIITMHPGSEVLGDRLFRPVVPARAATRNASVLGLRLPFTGGAEIWSFLAVALGMIAVGAMSLRSRSQKA